VRRSAASALAKLKDPRAVEPLTAALADDDSETRDAAAAALGRLGDSRAAGALLSAFTNNSSAAVAWALVKLMPSPVPEPLRKFLVQQEPSAAIAGLTMLDAYDRYRSQR
jgi:HEAT repeat protein